MPSKTTIHPTAEVSPEAKIGDETRIWGGVQVREGAVIGRQCIIGKDVYVDRGVVVGDKVKIQNRASLYRGLTVEDAVFVGPHVAFTNDRYPRSVTLDGRMQGDDDWQVEPTLICHGASIGAGAVIVCGVTVGRWAMIGAGAVVTRDVPDHALVRGNPARIVGYACRCGKPLEADASSPDHWFCLSCGQSFELPDRRIEHA
jgi:UDP-2-acetamido-3-amino-2,3-dideoxy-glucuronate N-acetyltransferase